MDGSLLWKALMTVLIVALMVPGLFFEPGPVSEIAGLGALAWVWGDRDDPTGGGG